MSEQAGPDPNAAGWRVLTRNSAGDLVWVDATFEQAHAYASNNLDWRRVQQEPSGSGIGGWLRKLFG